MKTSSPSDLQLIKKEYGVRYPDGHVEWIVMGEGNARAVADLVEGTVVMREIFRTEWEKAPPPLAYMPRVAGKPFRCSCGGNVFSKPPRLSGDKFQCNSCSAIYEGNR